MFRKFVERRGWTAFAALSSLTWALPLAGWAGAVDFNRAAWGAALLAAALFPVWLLVAWRARRWRVPGRYRWEPGQMSRAERIWTLLAAAAATGVIGWLNAAATVNWSLLQPGLASGRAGTRTFLAVALAVLAALTFATVASWRRASSASRRRLVSPPPE